MLRVSCESLVSLVWVCRQRGYHRLMLLGDIIMRCYWDIVSVSVCMLVGVVEERRCCWFLAWRTMMIHSRKVQAHTRAYIPAHARHTHIDTHTHMQKHTPSHIITPWICGNIIRCISHIFKLSWTTRTSTITISKPIDKISLNINYMLVSY